MGILSVALTVALTKRIPGSAAADAVDAAERAENSAELAQQYGYRLTIEDGSLVIGQDNEES